MSYLRRIETLDPAGSLVQETDSRLVLLTGQSSFTCAVLSPEQQSFLHRVTPAGYEKLMAGFPYHGALLPPERVEPALVAASVRNTLQALWSCCHGRYRRVVSETLQRLIDRTHCRLAIVTGSCGLQMANAVWGRLRIPCGLALRVVALGPVCLAPLRLPGAQVTVVLGDSDPWSRVFYRGPVHCRVICGHLDYWSSQAVRERVAALLAE